MRKVLCKMQLNVHNICKLDAGGDPMRDTMLKHCSATEIEFYRCHVHNCTNKSMMIYMLNLDTAASHNLLLYYAQKEAKNC